MQKLQESVFSIVKTTSLSPAVFSFLQPTADFSDKTLPLGGILRDTKYGWLALGPKFCVVDLRSGLKVAARTFGNGVSNCINVTSVVELPTALTDNSKQLIISLELDGTEGLICVFNINGSQLLRCIKTDVIITELAVCDDVPSGPLMCFDGLVMAGSCRGEIFVFDLYRNSLIQALKDISQGCEDLVRNEENSANLVYLPLKVLHKIERQRELAVENDDHIALLLNKDSFLDGQYIFRNPDGTARMKAKQNHIRVTVLQYIPQLGSLAVGFNFGAFQIWNMLNLELEYTSQVNVECLPVTHFAFQEPCDDPRAFCYLWVVFSVTDRFEEEEFPLAVMYSLTYQGKRMLTETKCLYQEFLTATVRFQVELCAIEDASQFLGGRCLSCHSYSISSTLGEEGEDTMLNLCQLVWECWGETSACIQYDMLLFDLDQWYKDQMPATYPLESNAFMSTARCPEISRGPCVTLDLRLDPASVSPYSHATRLEEHFYPNSLQYKCISLNTSEACALRTVGAQRQIVRSLCAAGPGCLLSPARLHAACRAAGLAPLYCDAHAHTPEEQRHFLLSVALEARLSQFLKRCAHDWATGTHSGVGCTLTFLVDWCWKRAIELKENANELTAPLFTSSTLPDSNVVRCLEHCVQQLTALTGLLDAVLTKCCNLVVPDALSEMEEKYKGIGTVSLYFQVVQWFVRVGLLPERLHAYAALPYPAPQLYATYKKRRIKLRRLQDKLDEESENKSCPLLYIDQLIEHEFGGERVNQMWIKGGSECGGLYPPPSLYALLRLYLLPDIALEHKHSLLLYLLLDYSMLYDEIRYEAVIRRLMQFPTMFGLSNTAIKATQAFWHLDHRDFDFALDQLQCLTGNTLSDWQHHVVLSSLLAQKKTQAALQYLHVKKPPPIQNMKEGEHNVNDHYKLEDWQSCCNLYLARGLVFEALDVIRMCVRNADSFEDKAHLMNFFYKGCRNTGQLSKVLQVSLSPLEEQMFVAYLRDCDEAQTSELLVMYYLQQGRYLEAEQYNSKIKSKGRARDMTTSVESIQDVLDREGVRETLVDVLCASLPTIATSVARVALTDFEPHISKPKPMSVYVQATTTNNKFTYKSSFIQDTIENASETWINKPKLRKGMKRALSIQETPFICTPKTYKSRNLLTSEQRGSEATPAKRAKLDLSGTPRTPKMPCGPKVSDALSREMASFLDMPVVQTPQKYYDRSGADTPQSILKNRRLDDRSRDAPSPADSRYLCDTDEEELETASNHTHYSDSTNKHLRFTIPTASEAESSPSPVAVAVKLEPRETEDGSERDAHSGSYKSTMSEVHPMESPPKKFAAEEVKYRKSYKDSVRARLSISANSSLSDDPNTSVESIADIPVTLFNPRYSGERKPISLSDYKEHNRTEIESEVEQKRDEGEMEIDEEQKMENSSDVFVARTPKGRRSIRSGAGGDSTPTRSRSRSGTPERTDSPVVLTPLRPIRNRSRSRTPEISPRSSPLPPILEQPHQEVETEPHPKATALSVPRPIRSRSRTPERQNNPYKESPRLEAIKESPVKATESTPASPSTRNLRSRSRTPEVTIASEQLAASPRNLRSRSRTPEVTILLEQPAASPRNLRSRSRTPEVTIASEQPAATPRSLRSRSRTPDVEIMAEHKDVASPRSLRSRSRTPDIEMTAESDAVKSPHSLRSSRAKTPEKLMSPKKEYVSRSKKTLTRIVLEANTFAKTKQFEIMETESVEEKTETAIECTPMKSSKETSRVMNINFSPITNKSVLQSPSDSLSVSTQKDNRNAVDVSTKTPLPSFTMNETYTEKSVLLSYESSVADNTSNIHDEKVGSVTQGDIKLPAFTTIHEDFGKSVLQSVESSIEECRNQVEEKVKKDTQVRAKSEVGASSSFKLNITDDKSVLASCESSVAEMEDSTRANRVETFKDVSSIMTSDSETEMKDNWKSQMEKQARVQREKEVMVEIERGINEIEGEMSDDCRVESDSGDGEIEEEDDEDEDSSVSEEEGSEEEEESEEVDDVDEGEIISIADSDESTDKERQQMDEPSETILVEEQYQIDEPSHLISDKDRLQTDEQSDPISDKDRHQTDEPSDLISGKDKHQIDKPSDPMSDKYQHQIDAPSDPISDKDQKDQIDEPSDPTTDKDRHEIDELSVSDKDQKDQIDEPSDPITDKDRHEIDEPTSSDVFSEPITVQEFELIPIDLNKEFVTDTEFVIEESMNELDQAQILSMLTDDNSVVETDQSNLNYSEGHTVEGGDKNDNGDNKMEIDQPEQSRELRVVMPRISEIKQVKTDSAKDLDMVDSAAPRIEPKSEGISTPPNKPEAEKTPEKEVSTPSSKKRSKTPTSTEVRRILTRRASKELGEDTSVKDSPEVGRVMTRRASKELGEDASVKDTPQVRRVMTRRASKELGKDASVKDSPEVGRVMTRRASKELGNDASVKDSPGVGRVMTRRASKELGEDASVKDSPQVRRVMTRRASKELGEDASVKNSPEVGRVMTRRASKKLGEDASGIDSKDVIVVLTRHALKKLGEDASVKDSPEVGRVMTRRASKELGEDASVKDSPGVRRVMTRRASKELGEDASVIDSKDVKVVLTRHPLKELGDDASVIDSKDVKVVLTRHPLKELGEDASVKDSPEVRRVMTRRASKELGEDASVIDEEVLTPRRRSTRSRSRKDDDDTDASTKSPPRKAGEDAGDAKSVKKRRPSILKPELTVIPEVPSDDPKMDTIAEIDNDNGEYSGTRRLTRHQQTMLEAKSPRTPRRRTRAASRDAGDDAASAHSDHDEGSVETDGSRASPDFTATRPQARLTRAASEPEAASPRAARASRRMSVDIAGVESGSPLSPARSRRASFTRACEAIHTPRRRQTSARSRQSSPRSEDGAAATPPARRASYTQK